MKKYSKIIGFIRSISFTSLTLFSVEGIFTFPSIPISDSNTKSDLCVAFDPDENAVAVWVENGMVLVSDLSSNGSWTLPKIVSNAIAEASSPRLEIDPETGEATILWLENNQVKAACRTVGEDWTESRLEPAILEAPSIEVLYNERNEPIGVKKQSAPPLFDRSVGSRLAIGLIPNTQEDLKGQKKEKKIPKGTFIPFSKKRPGDEKKGPIDSLSTNAIDAPASGSLRGGQIGFAAGTSAPSDGLIVSGNTYIGASSWSGKFGVVDSAGGFFFDGSGGTYASANRIKSTTTAAGTGRDLVFVTDNSGVNSALYINTSSQVGVGTSTIGTGIRLQVGGITDTTANAIRVANANSANANPVYSFFVSGAQENVIALENGFLLFAVNPASYSTANLQTAGLVAMGPSGGLCVGSSYINITPPTNGMIVQGALGVGTSTVPIFSQGPIVDRQYIAVVGSANRGVLQLGTGAPDADALIVGQIEYGTDTNTGGTPIKRIAGVMGVTDGTTANQRGGALAFYTTLSPSGSNAFTEKARISSNGCLQVGYAVATASSPPTNGMIVQGLAGFGVSSVTATTQVQITAGTRFNLLLTGTYSPVMSGFSAYDSENVSPTYSPSGSSSDFSSYFRGVVSQPSFISPSAQTLSGVCTCFYAGGQVSSNVGTITNVYGYLYDGGSAATGTVTNGYGGYFVNPSHGTNRAAIYTANLSVGYLATSPPSSGAIISGSVAIGTSTPSNKLTVFPNVAAPVPTLGTPTGAIALHGDATSYGLFVGVINNGNSWLQPMRSDGSSTAYNLLLNPSGGSVGVNASSFAANIVTTKLYVNGSITIPASTQLNLRNDAVGAESSGGLWIGYVSGSLDYCINNSADAGTPRAIAFTTSSNSAITGTISNGVLIWPLNGGITVGTTYSAARTQPPTSGALIQGTLGIGTTTPSAASNITINKGASHTNSIYVTGTCTTTGNIYEYLSQGALSPTGGGTNTSFIVLNGAMGAPSGQTITNAIGIWTPLNWGGNVGTISNAINCYIGAGTSGSGTITKAYGLYAETPVCATTNVCAYLQGPVGIGTTSPVSGSKLHINQPTGGGSLTVFSSGGAGPNDETLQFRTSYAMAANPIIGSIIGAPDNTSGGRLIFSTAKVTSGTLTEVMRLDAYSNVGIGTASPGSRLDVSVDTSFLFNTLCTIEGAFQGPNSSATRTALLVSPIIQPTFLGTITYALNTWSYPSFSPGGSCTISNAVGVYIDSGVQGGAGAVTNGYGLYVNSPAYGTNKFAALFVGSGTGVIIDPLSPFGTVYPVPSKGATLGSATNKWNTLYIGSAAIVGSSRLAPSQVKCPDCHETMIRGTGTLIILGETSDFIPCWCNNPSCRNKGQLHMDEVKHLPPDHLARRRAAPKIQFLGLKVCQISGNSRAIQAKFRYIDKKGESLHEGHIENATTLSDVEFIEFMGMTHEQRFDYLLKIGLREWNALEEDRLMREECQILQQELDALIKNWINTDLLKYK